MKTKRQNRVFDLTALFFSSKESELQLCVAYGYQGDTKKVRCRHPLCAPCQGVGLLALTSRVTGTLGDDIRLPARYRALLLRDTDQPAGWGTEILWMLKPDGCLLFADCSLLSCDKESYLITQINSINLFD